jgi:hypothetical protein
VADFDLNAADGLPCIPSPDECRSLPPRIKLRAVIGVEKAVAPLLLAGFLVLVIGLFLGPGKHGRPGVLSPETSLAVALGGGGGLMLMAGILWLLFDNYYLIDQQTGRVLLHQGLRFGGDDFPFLERGQIAAVGMNCLPRRGKYSQIGWQYTPVLLTNDDRVIKLSPWSTNMSCAKLPEYNWRVRRWAAALQCYWIACPSGQSSQAKDRLTLMQAVLEEKTA